MQSIADFGFGVVSTLLVLLILSQVLPMNYQPDLIIQNPKALNSCENRAGIQYIKIVYDKPNDDIQHSYLSYQFKCNDDSLGAVGSVAGYKK